MRLGGILDGVVMHANLAELRQEISGLIAEVRRHKAAFAGDIGNEADTVRMTAAALLARSLTLLEDSIKCADAGASDATVLVLRTCVETCFRGRYLATHPNGIDEHRRMITDWNSRAEHTAAWSGEELPGSPAIDSLPASTKKDRPRDLASIARDLDEARGLKPGASGTATYVYNLFYGFPSLVVVHAGLGAIKRYTSQADGRLAITFDPQPPLTDPLGKELLVAGLCGDLAVDVYRAFQIDESALQSLGISLQRLSSDT